MSIPSDFKPVFRISPVIELIGPVYYRGAGPDLGSRLAFANCYITAGEQRIVRASGVFMAADRPAPENS